MNQDLAKMTKAAAFACAAGQAGATLSPHQKGLTKREHFASLAMQGVMYHADFANCGPEPVAAAAVELADALLAELAKEQP